MTYARVVTVVSTLILYTSATSAVADSGCGPSVAAINAEIAKANETPQQKDAEMQQAIACARAERDNPGSYGNSPAEKEACAFRDKSDCDPNSPEAKNEARALELGEALPQYKRDAMVRKYQTIFAPQLHLDRYKIITASYLPQGSEYIVCGTGTMYKGTQSDSSYFIYDSRSGRVGNVEPQEFQRRCITSARVDLTQ
jgi:hypothetical protein